MASPFHFKWTNDQSKNYYKLLKRIALPSIILLLVMLLEIGINNNQIQKRLSEEVFENISNSTFKAVKNLYEPLLNSLYLSSLWVEIGEINEIDHPEKFVQSILNYYSGSKLISSMSITDSKNQELDLGWNKESEKYHWSLSATESEKSLSSIRNQNNITYMNHLDHINIQNSPKIKLSSPYTLPYNKEKGITLFYPLSLDIKNKLDLSIDFSLEELSKLISKDSIHPNSVIFIIFNNGDYAIFPIKQILDIKKNIFSPTTKEENQKNKLILETILKNMNSQSFQNNLVRVKAEGEEIYWAHLNNISTSTGPITIGSFAPESTLIVNQIQSPIQIGAILFLFMSLFYLLFLIQDYKRDHTLHQEEGEIEKIQKMLKKGENRHCEFKSSLRWDYREECSNKNLETVILKSIAAFSNSDGGTLFIGVDDDGVPLGLEKDYSCLKQSGKDYFELHLRTLLSNMFGVAYPVENIKCTFPKIKGIELCRIDITKGDQPLYITKSEKGSGKVEIFYVRSGNSSRQITSISEISQYILKHFS